LLHLKAVGDQLRLSMKPSLLKYRAAEKTEAHLEMYCDWIWITI